MRATTVSSALNGVNEREKPWSISVEPDKMFVCILGISTLGRRDHPPASSKQPSSPRRGKSTTRPAKSHIARRTKRVGWMAARTLTYSTCRTTRDNRGFRIGGDFRFLARSPAHSTPAWRMQRRLIRQLVPFVIRPSPLLSFSLSGCMCYHPRIIFRHCTTSIRTHLELSLAMNDVFPVMVSQKCKNRYLLELPPPVY